MLFTWGAPTATSARPSPLTSSIVPHDVSTGALRTPTVNSQVALVAFTLVEGCRRQKTTPGARSFGGE